MQWIVMENISVQAKPNKTRESAKNVINLQDAACHFIEDFKFDEQAWYSIDTRGM